MSVTPKLYEERMVKVYVSRGGKKFFQRAAAIRRGAWDLIKERCTCHWNLPEEEGDSGSGQFVRCRYHQEYGDYEFPEYQHRGLKLHRRIIERSKREKGGAP